MENVKNSLESRIFNSSLRLKMRMKAEGLYFSFLKKIIFFPSACTPAFEKKKSEPSQPENENFQKIKNLICVFFQKKECKSCSSNF